jgi:hypothetical protein
MDLNLFVKSLSEYEKHELRELLLADVHEVKPLTPTLEWIEKYNIVMGRRLYNGLMYAAEWFDKESENEAVMANINWNRRRFNGVDNVETINKKNFFKCNNLGKGSWEEFVHLRGY